MLFRLKWLLISIVVLYLFLIPYETIQYSDSFNFSILLPAFYRIAVLCVIIFSVNILLKTTTKEQIISAMAMLMQPITKVGVNLDSFLVRTYLTMNFVAKLNSELKIRKKNKKAILPFIMHWLESSVHAKKDKIVIDRLNRPDLLQWLIPVCLCFCYVFLLFINRFY